MSRGKLTLTEAPPGTATKEWASKLAAAGSRPQSPLPLDRGPGRLQFSGLTQMLRKRISVTGASLNPLWSCRSSGPGSHIPFL